MGLLFWKIKLCALAPVVVAAIVAFIVYDHYLPEQKSSI